VPVKNLLTLIVLPLLLVQPAIAQVLRQPISVGYPAIAAYSKSPDVFGFLNNQASLAQIKNKAAGVYGERRYMLAETSIYAAVMAFPTSLGNLGLSIKYAGFKNFNEHAIGLAYARKLGQLLDVGVQFNYYGYRIPAHLGLNTVNVEMGAIAHLSKNLNLGFHIYGPVGGHFPKANEKLGSSCKIGLGYDASDQFYFSAELVKPEKHPANFITGIQYQFRHQFFVRAGISSALPGGYAGVGIGWNNLRLDLAFSYHPQLGFSPGLLLVINPGQEEGKESPLNPPQY
jgi:hypothetical protein